METGPPYEGNSRWRLGFHARRPEPCVICKHPLTSCVDGQDNRYRPGKLRGTTKIVGPPRVAPASHNKGPPRNLAGIFTGQTFKTRRPNAVERDVWGDIRNFSLSSAQPQMMACMATPFDFYLFQIYYPIHTTHINMSGPEEQRRRTPELPREFISSPSVCGFGPVAAVGRTVVIGPSRSDYALWLRAQKGPVPQLLGWHFLSYCGG